MYYSDCEEHSVSINGLRALLKGSSEVDADFAWSVMSQQSRLLAEAILKHELIAVTDSNLDHLQHYLASLDADADADFELRSSEVHQLCQL